MKAKLPQRNRLAWFLLGVLNLAMLLLLLYIALRQPGVIIQQFRGQDGKPGQSVQGPQGPPGHTPVKGVDYFDGAKGDKGNTVVGPQGPQGIQGEAGPQGDQGPAGEAGANGREVEFRCNPKNRNFEWRYVGDESWRVLQKNSSSCKEAVL